MPQVIDQLESIDFKGAICGVTGASGVIGRTLIKSLVECNASIRALDIRYLKEFDNYRNLEFFKCNILEDYSTLDKFCSGCDYIFHLAAKMPQAKLDEAGFHKINVDATLKVVESAQKSKIKRFIFASTTEIYGAQHISEPLKEDDNKVFTGPYSRNKFEVEQSILNQTEVEAVALRMPMIFGPGFYHEKSILSLFWLLRFNLPIPIPVQDALVSFVSARDVAQGMIKAAVSKDAPGLAFNLAAQDYPTMVEFFNELIYVANSRSKIIKLDPSISQRTVLAAKARQKKGKDKAIWGTPLELVPFILTGGAYSIERAKEILGYQPLDRCVDAWLTAYRWYFAQKFSEKMRILFIYKV
jgi:dihydroflavonol-4-reductase